MLLRELVETSAAVAATRSRKAKVAAIAELLARTSSDELEVVVAYLSGSLRQRRTGIGWRGLTDLPPAAATADLTVLGVDAAFDALAALSGAGSQAARSAGVAALFASATSPEQHWLRKVVTGEVRQGALDAVVQEAIAVAAGVPVGAVRRATMLSGSTTAVAGLAFSGGVEALEAVRLEVLRPVLPMLASSAKSVGEAMDKVGVSAAIDTKLDGIRIQVHRSGSDVLVVTRSLDDITTRLPEVVALARSLEADSFVLDGEALALDADGRPRPFQETASRTASADSHDVVVTPYFFDLLHLDGRDLLDSPGAERAAALETLVPPEHRAARLVTNDRVEAEAFLASALAAGHEGVVVKDLSAPYAAGRRGAAWVKVKPVHTLDLVVLAVEWGSGRRRGWLSNLHLGARDPDHPGEFVMLGKTFKGLTDEMLAWQTGRFTELETSRTDWVVHVRPEQVVEIAFDGVQSSTRYRGGVALRFARVLRYRDDKSADEADTIASVREIAEPDRSRTADYE